jgi:hypothetical protein
MLRTNEGSGDYFTVTDEPATPPRNANKVSALPAGGLLLGLLVALVGYGGFRKLHNRGSAQT